MKTKSKRPTLCNCGRNPGFHELQGNCNPQTTLSEAPTYYRINTKKKGDVEIIDEKYNPVARMVFYPDDLDYKTAKQIVRAVNAFDAMLVALEAVNRGTEPYDGYIMTMVRQAIAKAEASSSTQEGK